MQNSAGISDGSDRSFTTPDIQTTPDAALDLGPDLAPKYIESIPFDPIYGSPETTFYCVKINNNNRLLLAACQPELGEPIVLKR